MADGRMLKQMKQAKKRSDKLNSKEKPLKCSTPRSEANPFVWEKKKEVWLTDEGQLYLESWASDGLSNKDLAERMNIGETTLYRWINEDTTGSIKSAIMRGREKANMQVENMLYKCAMGYEYEEEALTKDGDIVSITRYQPPSIEAQKFILTNRRKDKWKSKQEVEVAAQVQQEVSVNKVDSLADSLFGDDEK